MNREEHIGFRISQVSNLIRRNIEKQSEENEKIQLLHAWGISYLYDNIGKDIFQKDFEKQFSIRRSTASNLLKIMENNGLIRRISVPNDARLKKIILTEKAKKIHQKIVEQTIEREKLLRNNLTDEEIKLFFSITDKIIKNLEEEND